MATIDFLVEDGTAEKRVAAWREAFTAAGVAEIARDEAAAFTGLLQITILGDLLAVRMRADPFRLRRDSDWVRRAGRDTVFVNAVVEGTMRGTYNGRPLRVPAGSIAITSLLKTMDLEPPTRWTGFVVPKDLLVARNIWHERLEGRVLKAGSPGASALFHHMEALLQGRELTPNAMRQQEAITLALLAACLEGKVLSRGERRSSRENQSRQLRRYILDRIGDPELGARTICREFGLSPATLKRLLGNGFNLAENIRRLRVHRIADELLRAPDDVPLTAIAKRWGLADERTFRRAFTREFGCSPSRFRAERPTGAAPASAHRSIADLETWFSFT